MAGPCRGNSSDGSTAIAEPEKVPSPYQRAPWITKHGRNRHSALRLRFLRDWTGDARLPATALASFELYPWHSARLTARMRPDPGLVETFIWRPVRELGVPVFAFGAVWQRILEDDLKLRVVERFGRGGYDYGSHVPSRRVLVLSDEHGLVVVAAAHNGSASPPDRDDTRRLHAAVATRLPGLGF